MAGRKLTTEDDALWQKVKKTVRSIKHRPAPLHKDQTEEAEPKSGTPAHAGKIRLKPASLSHLPGAPRPPSTLGPALDPKSRRRLSRGRDDVDDRLDLHGYDQAAAHHALVRFLRAAQDDGKRLVLVITGKGRSERGEAGILRSVVPKWLAGSEFRGVVTGVEEAGRRHGGSGAIYVRLRRQRGD